jgi:hypothetical protein
MKYMKRKLFSELGTLFGVALFAFFISPGQCGSTSLIVIRATDHVILASDSQVIHDGEVGIPAKKIAFTKNRIATGVTGAAVLGQFNMLEAATSIAEAHKFADQADLHDIAQKWAEYTRDAFATQLRDHGDQVAKIVADGEKTNHGIYADVIFVGFGRNGDILYISTSLVKIAKDLQGKLVASITEVSDAPSGELLISYRAYAKQTDQSIQNEIVTNNEHLDIVNGFRSSNEADQICAAARFTSLAGKWYPEFVGGETRVAVLDRDGFRWQTIPDSCRK